MHQRPREGFQPQEDAVRHSREYWAERERKQAAAPTTTPEAEMLDLLRMAAHDMQAPLQVLKLNSQFLTDERSSPELRAKSKRIIKRVASRLEFLLQDILEMAEGGGANFVLHRTTFDVAEVLQQSVETYGILAEEMGMALDVDIQGPLMVEGDKMRLAQVCMNVVTESIWTAPRGSRILVQAVAASGNARLIVGCQPGRRTESLKALDTPEHATGQAPPPASLGVHLTRAILQQHGGSFHIERGPEGRCNTFQFRVPLAKV